MRLRRVPALYWILSLGLAACTSVTVFRLAAAADARARYWGTHAEVPVASRPVPAGALIQPDDVETRRVPEALLPQSEVVSDPVGLTAIVPLLPGEVLVEAKLAPAGVRGAAALLEPGQRAVAVPRNETTPPVAVGDRVDVILTFDPAGAEGGGPPAVVIAHAAPVLDVSELAVTVGVPAEAAVKVAFGAAQTALSLAVSSPADWSSASSGGYRDHDAAEGYPVDDEGGEAAVTDESQQAPDGGEPSDRGGAHAHAEGGHETLGQSAGPH